MALNALMQQALIIESTDVVAVNLFSEKEKGQFFLPFLRPTLKKLHTKNSNVT